MSSRLCGPPKVISRIPSNAVLPGRPLTGLMIPLDERLTQSGVLRVDAPTL